jgi:hypothetical protein
MNEQVNLNDAGKVAATNQGQDGVRWHAHWTLHKLNDPDGALAVRLNAGEPIENFQSAYSEVIERDGNLLMYGGASCLWEGLIGNMTASTGQALTKFDNTNAAIGTGDSTTAAAATQTDLQASSNKLRKAMDATYPTHTDAATSGAASIVFRSTFASSDGNYAWQEWGVFNSATAATGRMLNRKVESLGTKASGSSWTLTVTLSLA